MRHVSFVRDENWIEIHRERGRGNTNNHQIRFIIVALLFHSSPSPSAYLLLAHQIVYGYGKCNFIILFCLCRGFLLPPAMFGKIPNVIVIWNTGLEFYMHFFSYFYNCKYNIMCILRFCCMLHNFCVYYNKTQVNTYTVRVINLFTFACDIRI